MEVTVIIPNYNGIKYMDNCLKSLYGGTVTPEVIVVDNGSRDGSRELVERKYPAVRVIPFQENTGFCHAVNTGIQAAGTEYVILLNNDTVVEKHFVERLTGAVRHKANVFSAGAKLLSMKEPDVIDDAGDMYCALGWAFALGKGKGKEKYAARSRIFAACAGAAIYKKSVLQEIGGFDENHFAYLEDIDIGYRAQLFGYENLFIPEAVVYHAGSGVTGSRHNAFKVRLSARNSVYLISKNMPLLQILLNAPFLLSGFLIKGIFFAGKGLLGSYAAGTAEGVALSLSARGRRKRVPFRMDNLSSYCGIQAQLWINMFRRALG